MTNPSRLFAVPVDRKRFLLHFSKLNQTSFWSISIATWRLTLDKSKTEGILDAMSSSTSKRTLLQHHTAGSLKERKWRGNFLPEDERRWCEDGRNSACKIRETRSTDGLGRRWCSTADTLEREQNNFHLFEDVMQKGVYGAMVRGAVKGMWKCVDLRLAKSVIESLYLGC